MERNRIGIDDDMRGVKRKVKATREKKSIREKVEFQKGTREKNRGTERQETLIHSCLKLRGR